MRQEEFFKANKRDIKGCKFFSDNKDFAINKENFPQVFFEIVGLFAEDCEDALTQVESLSGVLLIAGQSNDGKKKTWKYSAMVSPVRPTRIRAPGGVCVSHDIQVVKIGQRIHKRIRNDICCS